MAAHDSDKRLRILCFYPNLVGYIRLASFLLALLLWSRNPSIFICFYAFCFTLDYVDGCLARKLDQCSAFGAWLDVFIDNFARGATWVLAAPRLGMFVVAVEWTVFCFTAAVSAEWKHKCFHSAPWFVKRLMSNNFINPIGIIAIAGLHFLPALQYVHHVCETPALKAAAVCSVYEALGYPLWIILVTGRLFCLFSECWVISRSLMAMLDTDAQRFTD